MYNSKNFMLFIRMYIYKNKKFKFDILMKYYIIN